MTVAYVTGGSGLVGRALIARLVGQGMSVLALARSRAAAGAVEEAGARPVLGDLDRPEGWAAEARAADVVWHLGTPRLAPPVRPRHVRAMAGRAARWGRAMAEALDGRPVVLASSGLVYGDREEPAAEDDPVRPLGLGRPAGAAETALSGAGLRVVRLPWVYGEGGLLRDVGRALRAGRYRVVGPGHNRWGLVSAEDAAAALAMAADLPPGVYAACEPDPPTQVEVVHALCAAGGARRPDHLPPRLAALSLGGAMAEALAASVWMRADRLAAAGWRPAAEWRSAAVSRGPGRAPAAG